MADGERFSGAALGSIAAGGLLVFAGLKGYSLAQTITDVIKGASPLKQSQTTAIAGSAGSGAPGGSGSPGSSAGPAPAPGAVNGCTAAQTAANRATGRLMAASYGWIGAQWNALDTMIGVQESGWCNNAQNPGSTAYGIGQFLDTTWSAVGYTKTSDPVVQIAAMLAYVKERYGNPEKAEAFHLTNGWY